MGRRLRTRRTRSHTPTSCRSPTQLACSSPSAACTHVHRFFALLTDGRFILQSKADVVNGLIKSVEQNAADIEALKVMISSPHMMLLTVTDALCQTKKTYLERTYAGLEDNFREQMKQLTAK